MLEHVPFGTVGTDCSENRPCNHIQVAGRLHRIFKGIQFGVLFTFLGLAAFTVLVVLGLVQVLSWIAPIIASAWR
jgi:hypothetical protein